MYVRFRYFKAAPEYVGLPSAYSEQVSSFLYAVNLFSRLARCECASMEVAIRARKAYDERGLNAKLITYQLAVTYQPILSYLKGLLRYYVIALLRRRFHTSDISSFLFSLFCYGGRLLLSFALVLA